jgi:hypothetical protein
MRTRLLAVLMCILAPAALHAGLDLGILPYAYMDKSFLTYESDPLNYFTAPLRWGYMDRTGKVLISHEYEEAGFFNDRGLAPVKKDGKWGLINRRGKMILEWQHGYIDTLPSGYFKAFKKGGAVYLDPGGSETGDARSALAPPAGGNEGTDRNCKDTIRSSGGRPESFGYVMKGFSHRNLPMVGLYRTSGERLSRPIFSGIETKCIDDIIRFKLRDGETVYFLLCKGVFLRPRLKQHGTMERR